MITAKEVSDVYGVVNAFGRYSAYTEKANFESIRFGHDKPILETELNELQQIQEEKRLELARLTVPSGFVERISTGFTGDPIVYRPTSNGLTIVNHFLIAPCKAVVAGHLVNVSGSFTYNKLDDYVDVDLGPVRDANTKDSLVYLEVWFEFVKGDDLVKEYGYADGREVGTPALDERVGEETSRRVVLKWDVRVKQECDFDTYPEGFGYRDILNYSAVFARAGGQMGNVPNVNAVFAPATSVMFEDEPFYGDRNLYVAGRPDYDVNSSTLVGNYVFALPMFRVRRRNNSPWSIDNPNGAASYNQMLVVNDSSVKGDLLNGMRPDRLAYDVVTPGDVLDVRRSVSAHGWDVEHLTDETLDAVLAGTLQTKSKEKMRRVQFGTQCMDYADWPAAELICPFEYSVRPVKPAFDEVNPIVVDKAMSYEPSVLGHGVVIDNQKELKYRVRTSSTDYLLSAERGTIDVYIQPRWNGHDASSQVLISLVNESDEPVIRLQKKGASLVLSQFNYPASADADDYTESKAILDLSETILTARRFYHLRIAWTAAPSPLNGQVYLYVNSVLCAQADYVPCHMTVYSLVLGSSENPDNPGVLMDTLVGYSKNFERIASNSLYEYARNLFWPYLPDDFKSLDERGALFLPRFDALVNDYADDAVLQEDTVVQLDHVEGELVKTFVLRVDVDRRIEAVEKVYTTEGAELGGVWTGLGTSEAVFRPYDQSHSRVYVQFTLALPTGRGGQDVPTEVLAVGKVAYETPDDPAATNYVYPLKVVEEFAFNEQFTRTPRQVPLLRPRKVAGNEDAAWDFSNEFRATDECWARLIYYNVSGNGTNTYTVPIRVYGFKVCGVVGCSQGKIVQVFKTPNEVYGEEDVSYTVKFQSVFLYGQTVTLELATEGYSVDVDPNSKTILHQVTRTHVLQFVADGVKSEYTVPCLSATTEGTIHGGVLRSVFTFYDNDLDDAGNVVGYTGRVQCYHNGQIFYDEYGQPTDRRVFNTQEVKILQSSFGTPFVTVIFTDSTKPVKDTVIQLPVTVSYQLPAKDLVSVWYSHVPFQGVMPAGTTTVRRLSEWRYFITTLSSGKPLDAWVTRNVVNNLPGGMAWGYAVDNQLLTEAVQTVSMPAVLLGAENLDGRFVLVNDVYHVEDERTCTLYTKVVLVKSAANAQDASLEVDNFNFDVYMNDRRQAVTKYVGAWCTVRVEATGEVMLLVVGNLDKAPSVVTRLRPTYGDLFRIEGRPTELAGDALGGAVTTADNTENQQNVLR